MVTGIRGLCNGIGPALYGFVFWIFRVSLNDTSNTAAGPATGNQSVDGKVTYASTHLLPGPPFLLGAMLATMAIFVTWMIPSAHSGSSILVQTSSSSASTSNTNAGSGGNASTSKQKDSTIVKLGNTSATYNRTGSGASLLAPLVSHKINESAVNNIGSSSALLIEANGAMIGESLTSDFLTYKNLQEKESLLSHGGHHHHHHHHLHHHERDDPSEAQLLLNSAASTLSMSLPATSSMATVQTGTATLSMAGDLVGNARVERSATPPNHFNATASVSATGLINQAFTNTLGKQANLSTSSSNLGPGAVASITSTSHVVNQTPNVKFKLNLD